MNFGTSTFIKKKIVNIWVQRILMCLGKVYPKISIINIHTHTKPEYNTNHIQKTTGRVIVLPLHVVEELFKNVLIYEVNLLK
jgi:hypothetical protein